MHADDHEPAAALPQPERSPPTVPAALPYALPAEGGDATGGLIPYKNPPALMAYYFGVFSVIPLFPIGLAGFVLGILGLKQRKRHPVVKGALHAWIGILVGGFFGFLWLTVTILVIVAALQP